MALKTPPKSSPMGEDFLCSQGLRVSRTLPLGEGWGGVFKLFITFIDYYLLNSNNRMLNKKAPYLEPLKISYIYILQFAP